MQEGRDSTINEVQYGETGHCESPAKAKTIGKYLGDGYEVMASMGHVRDLPASQLGIDVERDYNPQYINIKGKES